MLESFRDLGLRSELIDAVARAGYEAPSPLQCGAIPLIRRGGNAVIRGSAGAGVLCAYGLGLLDRLAETEAGADGGLAAEELSRAEPARAAARALVLAPTTDAAARLATSLGRFAAALGQRVRALAPGWAPAGPGTDIVVATPARALDAVQTSALKLDATLALIIQDAGAIIDLGHAEALDTLSNSLPRGSQRVLVSLDLGGAVGEYIERHVRRPLHVPARLAVDESSRSAKSAARLEYAVAWPYRKLDLLASVLAGAPGAGPVTAVVHCHTASRAELVATEIAVRGVAAATDPAADTPVIVVGSVPAPDREISVSFDVPFDAGSLAERHVNGGIVLIEPRELAHLRAIAEEAGFAVATRAGETASGPREELERYRGRLLAAARGEDLAAQLLVLDPLFEVLSPAEVAAAASALLRQQPEQAGNAAAAATPAAATPRSQAPAAAPADSRSWTRLFISAGSRDGIRPGDLVGSITGEASLAGEQVGRIEIRDTFSIVEVDSEHARRVIDSLNGTTLRGRSLRVDYDRRTAPTGSRRGGR